MQVSSKATGVRLVATKCAICATTDNSDELYAANFEPEVFNPAVFSARRLPDRIHYRMVRCRACGLVRSDPVALPELLNQLYAGSTFDYGDLVTDLQQTYGKYLDRLMPFHNGRGSLLEVGCGNGFFLEVAKARGYREVRGVEPSIAAIEKASCEMRAQIVNDVLRPGLFPDASFDVICLFQVFDHIPDPAALLDLCHRLLAPNGLVLCLNHNVESVSARLLKERSPIIDVEHTYLYGLTTLSKIFELHGFVPKRAGIVTNLYPLHYLFRLLPAPSFIKKPVLRRLANSATGRRKIWAPLGNLYLVAQKTAV